MAEVRDLHVVSMRHARRSLDVILGVGPGQRRPVDVVVVVDQVVGGAGVKGIDPQQGLVKGHRGHTAARQLGTEIPTFLVVVVQAQQFVDGPDGRQSLSFRGLFLAFGVDFGGHRLLELQPRSDQELLGVRCLALFRAGFFQGLQRQLGASC